MKVVISCAGRKRNDAGRMKTADGKPVEFVARPDEVVDRDADVVYARPDDVGNDGLTWRDRLLDYNAARSVTNPLNLLPAYKLYRPNKPYSDVYERLVDVFGPENVHILSAGWGLIKASFLLPKYDITFSASADRYKKRSKRDEYADFNQLDEDTGEALLFFGGNDYLSLFYEMANEYRGQRIVFHCSDTIDRRVGCEYKPYPKCFTNWHYQCANKIAEIAERFGSDLRGFDPLAVTW